MSNELGKGGKGTVGVRENSKSKLPSCLLPSAPCLLYHNISSHDLHYFAWLLRFETGAPDSNVGKAFGVHVTNYTIDSWGYADY